jgi:hypothetical protein
MDSLSHGPLTHSTPFLRGTIPLEPEATTYVSAHAHCGPVLADRRSDLRPPFTFTPLLLHSLGDETLVFLSACWGPTLTALLHGLCREASFSLHKLGLSSHGHHLSPIVEASQETSTSSAASVSTASIDNGASVVEMPLSTAGRRACLAEEALPEHLIKSVPSACPALQPNQSM